MADYLVFTLAAPLASFGSIAVGERRPTWDRPSKSQVLGLVAGALGIERTDEGRQRALAEGMHFAVRVDNAGLVHADYHTTQVPPARRNRRFATRADELAVDKTELKTILSRREFRSGTAYTIAIWPRRTEAELPSLERIATHLKEPEFAPFAGRKSHVLMLPMRPQVVTADDVAAAFNAYDATATPAQAALRADSWLPAPGAASRIYVDADAVPHHCFDRLVDRVEQRRDHVESRAKWRFGVRAEALLKPATGGGQ